MAPFLAVEGNDLQTKKNSVSAQVYLWVSQGCILDQEYIVFLFESNHLMFPWKLSRIETRNEAVK